MRLTNRVEYMKTAYWIVLRNILIYISASLIASEPSCLNKYRREYCITPAHIISGAENHIGLMNFINYEIVSNISELICHYIFLALSSQILILIYLLSGGIVVKGKIILQSKWFRIHNTLGIYILLLIVKWLDYTVDNYIRIGRAKARKYFEQKPHINKPRVSKY